MGRGRKRLAFMPFLYSPGCLFHYLSNNCASNFPKDREVGHSMEANINYHPAVNILMDFSAPQLGFSLPEVTTLAELCNVCCVTWCRRHVTGRCLLSGRCLSNGRLGFPAVGSVARPRREASREAPGGKVWTQGTKAGVSHAAAKGERSERRVPCGGSRGRPR